jgi:hypothetical protein
MRADVSGIARVNHQYLTTASAKDEGGAEPRGSAAYNNDVEASFIGHLRLGLFAGVKDDQLGFGFALEMGGGDLRNPLEACAQRFIFSLKSFEIAREFFTTRAVVVFQLRFVFVFDFVFLLAHADWTAWDSRGFGDGGGLFGIGTTFLPIPLSCERFLGPALFTRFQVERVSLDFLDDVFLLDLALETTQRAFERLAVLQQYFSQTNSPPSGFDKHPG